MKGKKTIIIIVAAVLLLGLTAGLVLAADDGPLFGRNISRTPETMTAASAMSTMWLYVPAQDTQGEPPDTDSGELEYSCCPTATIMCLVTGTDESTWGAIKEMYR